MESTIDSSNSSHNTGGDHFHDEGDDNIENNMEEEEEDVMIRAEAKIQKSKRWKTTRKLSVVAVVMAVIVVVVTLGSSWMTQQNENQQTLIIDDLPPPLLPQDSTTVEPSTSTFTNVPASPMTEQPHIQDDDDNGCLSDRFDNEHMTKNTRLFPGQFICSKQNNQRYRFGITQETQALVLLDTETNTTMKVYYDPSAAATSNNNATISTATSPRLYFFTLRIDGTFVLQYQENKSRNKKAITPLVVWQKKPLYHGDVKMTLSEQCLPDHDCPYLHLHKDGVLVLNWIDSVDGNWLSKNVNKVYGF